MLRNHILPFFILFLIAATLNSCQQNPQNKDEISNQKSDDTEAVVTENLKVWTPPASGVEVATYKKRIPKLVDKLYYQVTIVSTDSSPYGVYDVNILWKFQDASSKLRFPIWSNGHYPQPLIKEGNKKGQVLIGFDPGDQEFHEFYEVSAQHLRIGIQQTHKYKVMHSPEATLNKNKK